MSTLFKLFKPSNLRNIVSCVMTEPAANFFTTERFYSKRYTYCKDCPDGSKKMKKSKTCPDKRCKTERHKCVPFTNTKSEKKTTTKKAPIKLKKCKPGMADPCLPTHCNPTCTLTKGKGEHSVNRCEEIAQPICPKGDWDRRYEPQ